MESEALHYWQVAKAIEQEANALAQMNSELRSAYLKLSQIYKEKTGEDPPDV